MLTSSESSSHLHTLGTALCRHNVVVVSVSFELLSEGDGDILIHCIQGVLISQVGVGWVCTILNSAVIPSHKKCTLHNCITRIRGVNTNLKNVHICAIYGERHVIVNSTTYGSLAAQP